MIQNLPPSPSFFKSKIQPSFEIRVNLGIGQLSLLTVQVRFFPPYFYSFSWVRLDWTHLDWHVFMKKHWMWQEPNLGNLSNEASIFTIWLFWLLLWLFNWNMSIKWVCLYPSKASPNHYSFSQGLMSFSLKMPIENLPVDPIAWIRAPWMFWKVYWLYSDTYQPGYKSYWTKTDVP